MISLFSGGVETIHQRAQTILTVLLEAYLAARDVEADLWDFAVEIEELRRVGATLSELRWLMCKGLIEHTEEFGSLERRFRARGHLTFSAQSCFILTAEGKRWIDKQNDGTLGGRDQAMQDPAVQDVPQRSWPVDVLDPINGNRDIKPYWDEGTRQLRFGSAVVKEFKSPATNQVRIIMAFQEESWPIRIDDPLPQVDEIDPKRRLHDAINAFNRHQKTPLIRLKGDGTGEGVVWEAVSQTGALLTHE